MNILRLSLLVAGILIIMMPSTAFSWTAQEIRAMPPYCAGRYARNTNSEEYKRWEAQYGPDFLHTHHLCDAIGTLNNLYKANSSQQRRTMLKDIMGNLNYMIQHAKPEFALMPEVYWYRSTAHGLMGDRASAINDLKKVVSLDTKQIRAYLQLAEHLSHLGRRDEALLAVSEGLRHNPNSGALKNLYVKLGGREPYPEPILPGAQPSESAPDTPEQAMPQKQMAMFDFSKVLRTASNAWQEAGAYYYLEVTPDRKALDTRVNFRILSQIPQPATRVPRIGIDLGRHRDLFVRMETNDSLLGKYYPMKWYAKSFNHAFWPGFSPDYMAHFTIDPKEGKMYDPHALPPGNSLTITGTLAPGRTIADVVQALKAGLVSPDGMRFALILHHTKGYRPDPRKTIMDDGGFALGRLLKSSGFDENQAKAPDPVPQGTVRQETPPPPEQTPVPATPPAVHGPTRTMGTPSNPWCRFCPEPSP